MQTLQYLKKNAHENIKKTPSKVAYLWQFGFFFYAVPTVQIRKIHIINSSQDSSLWYVLAFKATTYIIYQVGNTEIHRYLRTACYTITMSLKTHTTKSRIEIQNWVLARGVFTIYSNTIWPLEHL